MPVYKQVVGVYIYTYTHTHLCMAPFINQELALVSLNVQVLQPNYFLITGKQKEEM